MVQQVKTGVVLMQTKDHQGLPAALQPTIDGSSPEPLEGAWPCYTRILDSWPSELWDNEFMLF